MICQEITSSESCEKSVGFNSPRIASGVHRSCLILPILVNLFGYFAEFCLDRVFQVSTHGCFAYLLGDLPFVKIFLRFVSALPLSLVSAIRVASSVVSVYHDVLISFSTCSVIAIVMDLYSSFAGFDELIAPPVEIIVDDNLLGEHPWLKLMIEPVFLYGSLSRPLDLQSPMVCVWIIHSISHQLSSGTVYCCVPHEPCIDSEDSFRHPNLSRQGEIWLDNLMQNHQLVIAPRCLELNGVGVISEIVPALCCVDGFIHLVSMGCEAVPKMLLVSQGLRMIDTDGYGFYATDVAIQILQLIAEEFFFFFLFQLCFAWSNICKMFHSSQLSTWLYTKTGGVFFPSYPICKLLNSSTKDTKSRTFTLHNLVFLVLLQQSFHPVSLQRQSQDYDFIRQTIVIHSGWFGSILEFLYGSLPRPPDVLYVFSPNPTILMVVQVQDETRLV